MYHLIKEIYIIIYRITAA